MGYQPNNELSHFQNELRELDNWLVTEIVIGNKTKASKLYKVFTKMKMQYEKEYQKLTKEYQKLKNNI